MATIYIDTETGVWGDPKQLRFVELPNHFLADIMPSLSDSQIIALATEGN